MIPASPPVLAPGFFAVPSGHVAAIVTALEMTAPPQAEPRRLPDEVVLRRVERPDPSWYRELFRAIGEDWLWASRLSWDDARLSETIHDPAVEISALVPAGAGTDAAIGLAELDFRVAGTCEVAFFGLAPGWTGRGFGRPMMGAALARAWGKPDIVRVWIHTCTLDDPRALGFYQSCGFRAFTRQVEILPDPRLGGLLPRSVASGVPIIAGS